MKDIENDETIQRKQNGNMKDRYTLFMYEEVPETENLYKRKVTESDVPYNYQDKNLTITTVMNIKLLRRYEEGRFSFDRLKKEYGIYAIRGPRGVPNSLSHELNL